MAQVIEMTAIWRKRQTLNAARRVQCSPVLPDGSIPDRAWAVYVRDVMEQLLRWNGVVPSAEVVMRDLDHLRYLEVLVLTYDEESWVWE